MRRQRPAQLVDELAEREAAVFIRVGGLEEGRDVDGSYFDAGLLEALGEFGRRERAVSILSMLRNWAARPPAPLAPVAARLFCTFMMTRVSMVLVVAALAYLCFALARLWCRGLRVGFTLAPLFLRRCCPLLLAVGRVLLRPGAHRAGSSQISLALARPAR